MLKQKKSTVKANKKARLSNKKRNNPPKRLRKTDQPTASDENTEEISQKDAEELNKLAENIQTPTGQTDRFYCTNAELLKEMYNWRNSSTNGLPVMKLGKNGKLIPTEVYDDVENHPQRHEEYKKSTTYVIKYPKTHKRYLDWQDKLEKLKKKEEKGLIKKGKKEKPFERPSFYKIGRDYVIEDVTKLVEYNGWTFDIDDPLDPVTGRKMSENFGRMIMMIAQRISNHSYFRNYSLELKQDCQSYSYEKIIKGLFNYSFKYTTAFAYLTQACFNSFKSILSKHYKQINIKRAMTKKAMVDLDASLPGSSMRKSLNNQFEGNDFDSFQDF